MSLLIMHKREVQAGLNMANGGVDHATVKSVEIGEGAQKTECLIFVHRN